MLEGNTVVIFIASGFEPTRLEQINIIFFLISRLYVNSFFLKLHCKTRLQKIIYISEARVMNQKGREMRSGCEVYVWNHKTIVTLGWIYFFSFSQLCLIWMFSWSLHTCKVCVYLHITCMCIHYNDTLLMDSYFAVQGNVFVKPLQIHWKLKLSLGRSGMLLSN